MNRQLGVVILSQYFHPEVGATQTRARELAKAFLRAGHRVTVVCEFPNHPQGIIPDSYRGKWFEWDELDGFRVLRVRVAASPVKNFKTRLAFYLSYMFMAPLAAFRRLGRVDVVLATSPPLPVAAAGWWLAVLRHARFVMDVRDLWPDAAVALGELSKPWMIKVAAILEKFLYRRALLVTAVTSGFVEAIVAKGIKREKVRWFPNGTLPDLFSPNLTDPALRAELNPDNRFLITFAGLFGIAQGMDFLLTLAASYRGDDGIRFLFIGTGPLQAQMEERVEEEELDTVLFHPQVPLERAAYYLNASDLLLVPLKNDPIFETFIPSKLFDFLACKPPVLLAVPGEAEEILAQSGGGLAAKPEDLASFRAAIETLRSSPAVAAGMGAAGAGYVLEHFSREVIMDGLVRDVEAEF
ncbi:MAG: glycosyltransferase family 4 protein [bacterium]|nr:glycosyltransferase family 4 protein [bacterium]